LGGSWARTYHYAFLWVVHSRVLSRRHSFSQDVGHFFFHLPLQRLVFLGISSSSLIVALCLYNFASSFAISIGLLLADRLQPPTLTIALPLTRAHHGRYPKTTSQLNHSLAPQHIQTFPLSACSRAGRLPLIFARVHTKQLRQMDSRRKISRSYGMTVQLDKALAESHGHRPFPAAAASPRKSALSSLVPTTPCFSVFRCPRFPGLSGSIACVPPPSQMLRRGRPPEARRPSTTQ